MISQETYLLYIKKVHNPNAPGTEDIIAKYSSRLPGKIKSVMAERCRTFNIQKGIDNDPKTVDNFHHTINEMKAVLCLTDYGIEIKKYEPQFCGKTPDLYTDKFGCFPSHYIEVLTIHLNNKQESFINSLPQEKMAMCPVNVLHEKERLFQKIQKKLNKYHPICQSSNAKLGICVCFDFYSGLNPKDIINIQEEYSIFYRYSSLSFIMGLQGELSDNNKIEYFLHKR